MTFQFGSNSIRCIETVHPVLQEVLVETLLWTHVDFAVVCGSRGRAAQTVAFNNRRSKTPWPRSKHNCVLADGITEDPHGVSIAFDVAPYVRGIPWKDEGAFYMLSGQILGSAKRLGVELTYGGDWDRDGLTEDQRFMDLGHFQGTRQQLDWR